MKFVLVNGRTPLRTMFCLQCCKKISGSYLRELRMSLPYCDYECYARHCELEVRTMGARDGCFTVAVTHPGVSVGARVDDLGRR
ncbi:hypothetical protein [Bradyrhizobium genosp. A]|uniref:hypothetical protein n=1 Tax=Bradyrhizobium genosp. A TaxID=83626 RepID=UPI003CF2C0EC